MSDQTITARTGGPWRIRNEVRAMENLPPLNRRSRMRLRDELRLMYPYYRERGVSRRRSLVNVYWWWRGNNYAAGYRRG